MWSDRLSLKSACGLRVSRPLCAVRRRLLGVSEAVGHVAGVEFVERRTVLWGLGRAYNQGAQGVVSALLGLEWRNWRRSGAIPTKGRRAGLTCFGSVWQWR